MRSRTGSRAGASWAVVLAGGSGTRLRSLTRDASGREIPKQFCSLHGGRALIDEALERARAVADPGRVLVVVTEEHRPYWERLLDQLPEERVLVQPENRGTGPGMLLPLLAIRELDPEAQIAWIPSDHHVRSEATLQTALHLVQRESRADGGRIALLGMLPDGPEVEYGWILPEPAWAPLRRIVSFVEKPPAEEAERLLAAGAVWNSFLLAGAARAFLDLFRRRRREAVEGLQRVLEIRPQERPGALARLYATLPSHDFSRDVLQGSERHLRVHVVPPCGWTDLGTPRRVAECLRERSSAPPAAPAAFEPLRLDLALASAGVS